MLKKMRWHFILAAMLAVFIMLVAVLAGINVWNYTQLRKSRLADSGDLWL